MIQESVTLHLMAFFIKEYFSVDTYKINVSISSQGTARHDAVDHVPYQLHHLHYVTMFSHGYHIDHQHLSYLFDDSVGVVEEGQGDDGPGGDGEPQQVPGHTGALYGSQCFFGLPTHPFVIHIVECFGLLATWQISGTQSQ